MSEDQDIYVKTPSKIINDFIQLPEENANKSKVNNNHNSS